jgi:hypothetical protein
MPTGTMRFGADNDAGTTAPTFLRAQRSNRATLEVWNEIGAGNTAGVGLRVRGGPYAVRATAGEDYDQLGIGVFGDADGTGVLGEGRVGVGGNSVGGPGPGVWGISSQANGVQGMSQSRAASGVYGENFSGAGFGIAGRSNIAPEPSGPRVFERGPTYPFPAPVGAAVFGDNPAGGMAGLFNGSVRVLGPLFKPGLFFQIDNPQDPETSFLSHSGVESPDMMNVYNGNVTTDADGIATVELPDYFEALNRDFRYQLTVVGEFAQAIVAEEIAGNHFTIRTDRPDVKVSWQVTGVRQDAWAEAHRVEAVVDKPEAVRGKYLAPTEHGQPAEAGIYFVAPEHADEAEGIWRQREDPTDT